MINTEAEIRLKNASYFHLILQVGNAIKNIGF